MTQRPGRTGLSALPAISALLAVAALTAPAAAQCLEATLFAPGTAATSGTPGAASGAQFGFAVDVSGGRVIVGAPGDSSDPLAHSGFGLYEQGLAGWSRVYDGFGLWGDDDAGIDVALSGDWAAVGVPRIATRPAAPGQVLVLQRVAAGWRLAQTLSSEPGYGEQFGLSVDLDGGLLAVGLRSDAVGAVHVFRLTGDTWVLDELIAPDPASTHGFGRAVAVLDAQAGPAPRDALLLVGEPGHAVFGGGTDDGAAHVLRRDASLGWVPLALLQSSLPGAQLGTAVALSSEFAVAGAPFADAGSFIDEGLTVVARWNGTTYASSVPIPGTSGSLAGWSLAADDERFYYGAPGWGGLFGDQETTGLLRGYAFEPSPPAWTLWPNSAAVGIAPIGALGTSGAPGPGAPDVGASVGVGRSVAVDGTRLVLGAPGKDGASPDVGGVWIYDLSVPAWSWDEPGLEGSLGPALSGLFGEGSLCSGDGLALHLHGAQPSTVVALVVGLSRLDAPFLGGTLIPKPDVILFLPTDAAGELHVDAHLPREFPAGTDLWLHAWWPDAGGPQGFAASNVAHGLTH